MISNTENINSYDTFEKPPLQAVNGNDTPSFFTRTIRSVKNTALKLMQNPFLMEPAFLITTYAINHLLVNLECRLISANTTRATTFYTSTLVGGITGYIVGGAGGYINGVINGVAKEESKRSAKDPDYVGMRDTERNSFLTKSLFIAARTGLLAGALGAAYISKFELNNGYYS